jgi:hypothetical protein
MLRGKCVLLLASFSWLFVACSADMTASKGVKITGLGSTVEDIVAGGGDVHIMARSKTFVANQDLAFTVHAESLSNAATFEWSHTLNDTSQCTIVTTANNVDYTVRCAAGGTLKLSLVIVDEGKNLGPLTQTVLVNAIGAQTNIVTFDILNGTGDNAWNSMATQVEVYVGQTLRIRNLDATVGAKPKRLHTNGKPCPHFDVDIPLNGTADCVISTSYNAVTDGTLYNHNVAPSARFYLLAHDGKALYTAQCASCHGAVTNSAKKGSSAAQIAAAIQNVSQMNSRAALKGLTPKQLEAIAFAIK